MFECENEPVSEGASVSGSGFGPESWFVCVCEPAASAWLGAAETGGRLPRDDCRWAGTGALQHYRCLSVQRDGSPDMKQVDPVGAADSHQGASQPVL